MRRVRAVLSDVNNVVRKHRSLKTVQEPACEIVDAEEEMVKTKGKNVASSIAKPIAVANLISAEKENSPVLRRSKRKQSNAVEQISYADSPTEPESSKSMKNTRPKAKKPSAKTKKSRSTVKNDSKTDLNQTKLNFTQLPTIDENCSNDSKDLKPAEPEKGTLGVSFSSAVTEDSGYAPSARTSNELTSDSIVFNSPDVRSYPVTPINSENSILSCSTPPITYWMDLAEQRRAALEKALQENELLHDQMAVLEVENAQLKNLLKEAEKMARILKGIVG